MIYQRLSTNAPAAEKLLSFQLYGHPAIFATVWAFGDVVEMVGPAMGVPTMGSPSMAVSLMADPEMET